jgi:hypothetical protein
MLKKNIENLNIFICKIQLFVIYIYIWILKKVVVVVVVVEFIISSYMREFPDLLGELELG